MQEQIGAKIGAFVFFFFGVMMLALGVWGITTQYDQGGILTWGIVLGFGGIFALTGIVLFINSMKRVSDRVKQLGGTIVGSMICLGFGAFGILANGLGILRLVLLFFGCLGIWILIQGIRNFAKGDSEDADQTSGRVQWSGGAGGRINGQKMDGGYQPYQTPEYESYDGEYNSPVTDARQNSQWQQETPGTPFSGSAENKVYTSQVNDDAAGYGSGLSPEFDRMMNSTGMDSEQQEKARKIGSAVQKGANIYAGIMCIVVGGCFILANSIIVLSFIVMLIQTASLMAVMSSLFSTVMSAALLVVGIFMVIRGVKIIRGKILK